MNEMLYINVNSVGLNPEVVNRLNQSNIKILYDFNKHSLEEIENILGDMFSQIKSILIYYKLPRSINKLSLSKELVFMFENNGISDLITLVKSNKFKLYQLLKDNQSLLNETNKILEFYGKEKITRRFSSTTVYENVQSQKQLETTKISMKQQHSSSPRKSGKSNRTKYVTTHSSGKPSDFIFSESRNVRLDVLNKELSDSRKIIEEEITVDNSQTKNTVRQTIEVLTIPVESLKLSQTALDRLKLSGIARVEDFNIFNLKELQMLLGNSFDEVLPTLIYFRLPRDIKDLSLSNETIGLLSMYGIADTMTLIEYDRGKLYELFSIDKFLLNEINNLFELYNENPLTSETIRTKSPKKLSVTYMNFSRKEVTKVLTIPIEQLKITEETYDALLIAGIKTLEDLNKFNLRDLQLLMGYSFDELLPILVYYKIPRDLSKLSLSSETISILKKAGISDSKTLLRHNTRILTDIFKDKAVLLKEVQQIMKLYFSKNTVEENSIIDVNKKITVTSKKTCEYNGVEANKNGSRSLLDVLYSLYPKYNKTPNIIDLNIIFKQGIMIMGWEEFSRLINNESEINKQLNLKPFIFNIQQQFNKFKQLNIVDRIFLKTPEGNYIKMKDERTNFDKLYDVFINTSIFFMDYKDEYKFDFSNTKLKKLIEQFTFNTISYNNIDKKNFNRIQCYYDEFKKINGNEIHNFIHSQNEVFQFVKGVQTNKEKFKKSLHLMDLYSVLDLAVDGLHPDNYHIQLDKVLSTELSDLLKGKNIHNLIDFKRINTKDILQLNELSTFHDELYNVILDLNKSYLDEIYDLLYEMSEKLTDRDTFVLINRAKNRTLEQIGKKLGVTRERIRQIENKQYRKLVTSNAMKKILRILEKVQKDISIITQDDVNKMGKEQAWLLETLLKKYWNRSLGIYLIDIKDYEVLKLKYKELDEHYSVEDSEYTSLDEISKLIIDSKYHKLGKHYFKKRPTKPVEYKIIVEKYFEEGLHIYNENHIKKFKRYYGYEYETNELEDMSSRAFSGRIVAITGLVPVDRGFYRMQDYELPLDLIKKLKADVIKHQSLMISTLYARHKSDLKKASIKNRYQLHGVLNKYLSEFHLNRDMISVSQHHQSSSTSILDVLFQHEPGEISISDIKKAIPGITDIVLYSYITNRGDYVSVDYGKIKHIKELIFSSTDHNKISLKISNMLKSRHFITTEALYDEIIGYEFHHIIEQNRITSKRFMYNFIQHYYRDEFQFTNYTILPLGEEYISVEDRIISIVKPHNKIIIKELMDQIENNGIKINSKQNILSLIYEQGYLRIDDETIIKKELLNFPEVFINQIENLLIDSMLGNRITTKQITNYSQFPKIKIPWNKHLLGNLMINFSRKIKVKDISKSYVDIEFEFKEKKK